MFLMLREHNLFALLAASHVLGTTSFYYVSKFLWLSFIPVVLLVTAQLSKIDSVSRHERLTNVAGAVFLLVAGFTAANTPNIPWIPAGNRTSLGPVAEELLSITDTAQPRLYFRFLSESQDHAINQWLALDWEEYPGNGLPADGDARATSSGPFGDAGIADSTLDAAAQCSGVGVLPDGALVVTRDRQWAENMAECATASVGVALRR